MSRDSISYIRISSKDQSRYSLEYQEKAIIKYCKDNDLNLVSSFKDNGESSYTFDRPDWMALERFIKKNKSVKYLIIYDHDRFSRNLAEALLKIKELNDKYGIFVVATTEQIKIDQDDPMLYISRAFKYMMGESELMRIRERTKAGIHQAAINGYYTNRAPYGYRNIRTADGKPTLEIDPVKGPVIKKIFKLRSDGLNPEEIRRLVKPLFHHRNKSAIQDILKNPIYMGKVLVNEWKGSASHYVKGKHEPIISEIAFLNAQKPIRHIKAQPNNEVPLKGVLKCWCGRPVTVGNSRSCTGRYYWYYFCNEHRENYAAKKLHNQMNEMLTLLSLSYEDVTLLKEKIAYRMGQLTEEMAQKSTSLKREITVLNSQIKALERKYLTNSKISASTFSEMLDEYQNQKTDAEKKLKLQSALDAYNMNKLEVMFPKLLDLKNAYSLMDLSKKKKFLTLIFGDNLTYEGQSYRTTELQKMFSHKALILKEKGLLESTPLIENHLNLSTSIGEQT